MEALLITWKGCSLHYPLGSPQFDEQEEDLMVGGARHAWCSHGPWGNFPLLGLLGPYFPLIPHWILLAGAGLILEKTLVFETCPGLEHLDLS
jgi:hypothetical protein